MDRISHLPKEIRSHIVSFLPFEEAIRISILSRQWRHICSSLSNLDFSQDRLRFRKKIQKVDHFKDMINKTLRVHDGSGIKEFVLQVRIDDAYITTHDVNAWINFAVSHNVCNLEISEFSFNLEKLPFCVFTCSTLTVLKLLYIRLVLPSSSFIFPMVKTLELTNVKFCDESESKRFLSNVSFPVLEDLSMTEYTRSDCGLACNTTRTIDIPTLKYLYLIDDGDGVNISLLCPALQEIVYRAYGAPNNCFLNSTATLTAADFDFWIDSVYATKIFTGLASVRRLSLWSGFVENLTQNPDLLSSLPATHDSLNSLVMGLVPAKNHVQVATLILRSSPNLQTLRIYFQDDTLETPNIIINNMPEELPTAGYVLNNLKTAEIHGLPGSDIELEIVEYILGYSCNLEKISISYSMKLRGNKDEQTRIANKLFLFSRASPHAEIIFLEYQGTWISA